MLALTTMIGVPERAVFANPANHLETIPARHIQIGTVRGVWSAKGIPLFSVSGRNRM